MKSFADLMFTDAVQAEQEAYGSRKMYAKPYRVLEIGEDETAFIETRTSFYMATVNSDGWPYVQHRGGEAGFLKVTGPQALAFADYPGNRQYVSTGNLSGDNRVSLFLMDYPRRARLKILARATFLTAEAASDKLANLKVPENRSAHGMFEFTVEALDWNCPKYITPRFTEAEIEAMLGPEMRRMGERIAELEKLLEEKK